MKRLYEEIAKDLTEEDLAQGSGDGLDPGSPGGIALTVVASALSPLPPL